MLLIFVCPAQCACCFIPQQQKKKPRMLFRTCDTQPQGRKPHSCFTTVWSLRKAGGRGGCNTSIPYAPRQKKLRQVVQRASKIGSGSCHGPHGVHTAWPTFPSPSCTSAPDHWAHRHCPPPASPPSPADPLVLSQGRCMGGCIEGHSGRRCAARAARERHWRCSGGHYGPGALALGTTACRGKAPCRTSPLRQQKRIQAPIKARRGTRRQR